MSKVRGKLRLTSFLAALALVLPVLSFVSQRPARAADVLQRSVRIGSSIAGEVTTHRFQFSTQTAASIGSMVFEYCSNLPFYGSPCTAPVGLVVNASSVQSQTGLTGFSVDPGSTANRLVVSRGAAMAAPVTATITFSNITNPTTSNQSVYVRISTHSSTDGTGAPVDFGAVVFRTVPGVGVGGFVPPYLTFCVGVTVAADCSSASGDIIGLGELSTSSANASTSQFAAATNDPTGYNVFISGGTMTSGNEVIPPLASNASSQAGTSQFGINLLSNSSPGVGANVSGAGSGVPAAGYGIANSFRYNDGELIARSPLPTAFNRFTISYLVNVSDNQRPGIYASSFTYTAIASF